MENSKFSVPASKNSGAISKFKKSDFTPELK
jgi:hypothetical protein